MKIAIDVDGVVLNWYHHACKLSGITPKPKLKRWSIPELNAQWGSISQDPEYWQNIPELQPYTGIDFDCYLTAMPAHFRELRVENIKQTSWPDKPVYVATNKVQWMLENGYHVLFDDRPATIEKVQEAGLIGIQFYPPYAGWRYSTPVIKDFKNFV